MKPVTHYDRNVVAVTPAHEAPEPVTVKGLAPSARRHHQGANPRQPTHRAGIGVVPVEGDKPHSPEQTLWLNVIRQALEDAIAPGQSGHDDIALIQRHARAWFEGNGKDFRDVCLLAGLDPDVVREAALKRIAEGSNSAMWGGSSTRRRPGRPRKAKPARPQSALMRRLFTTTALTPIQRVA